MSNETINPINHGVVSSTGQTLAGAVGGGVKAGVKTWGLSTIYTGLAFGAIAAVIAFTGGAGALGFGTLGTLGNALTNFAFWGALGTGVGAVTVGPVMSMFGGAFGAAKGGANAYERVREEKGAANMMQAQLSAVQANALAQASAPTIIHAPSVGRDEAYGQGSPKLTINTNAANDNTVDGSSVQYDGKLTSRALER